MDKINDEVKFQKNLSERTGSIVSHYACVDESLTTSERERREHWFSKDDERKYGVDILLHNDASKVHVIKNFISPEECAAIETALPQLNRAIVSDQKGSTQLSPNSATMQSLISIPWEDKSDGDFLQKISRRVYDYTNHVLKMGVNYHGQEDLMVTNYSGQGEEKDADRHIIHCDGDCDGIDFREGQRVATMIMHCAVPTKGGATHFRKSNLHILAEEGTAIFLGYVDPKTFKADKGMTEYNACPVLEGEKKIVTQWIRYGVDAEKTWDTFDS